MSLISLENDQILSIENYKKVMNKEISLDSVEWIRSNEGAKEDQIKYWKQEFLANDQIE